jgi:t-SNARE complex subunit (syntaxin)
MNSIITDRSNNQLVDQHVELDYEIERKILAEKKQLLDEVEQSTMRVNEIMTDMAGMVNEQGENLDVISEELLKTQKNVDHTNE